MKTRVAVPASAALPNQKTIKSIADGQSTGGATGLPSDVERRPDDGATDAAPQGKREGASRVESIARTDFRKIADPDALASEAAALTEQLRSLNRELEDASAARQAAETVFKAFGRALHMAVEIDPRTQGVPSTKGSL